MISDDPVKMELLVDKGRKNIYTDTKNEFCFPTINDHYLKNILLVYENHNVVFQDRFNSSLLIAYSFIVCVTMAKSITHSWSQ